MPLLSEEEKIAVMKQTGYVNPTYKFLTVMLGTYNFVLSICTQHLLSFNPHIYGYMYEIDRACMQNLL